MKNNAIIVDIDGTLANVDHRRKDFLIDKSWNSFNEKMILDTLNQWCVEIIYKFKTTHTVILLTGRRAKYENQTLNWLKKFKVPYDFIYFRGADDFREDSIVKKELYEKYVKESFNILFVIDDRQSVVNMWRSCGLVCLQCDYGNF